jgi:hypothetical protein
MEHGTVVPHAPTAVGSPGEEIGVQPGDAGGSGEAPPGFGKRHGRDIENGDVAEAPLDEGVNES